MARANRAVSLGVSALIVIVIILIVGFGIYLANTFNSTSTTASYVSSPGSSSTGFSQMASTSCYSSTLPSNETVTTDGHSEQTLVFNVTTNFDEGDWVSFLGNPIHFASYNFLAFSPNSTSTYIQLEPQLFVNVSESGTQVNTQRAAWTDLGGFNGSNWPPDLSPSSTQVLFGNVMMRFLFPCNTRGVMFEIVVGQNGFSGSASQNTISLQGFSLCPSNCVYPSPYLSGNIMINGSVPISSIVMYVNGTYNGYALQNPSVRTLSGSCTGNPDEICTQEAGGTCVGSAGQTSCTYQYASCYIESGETSCTAVVTGATNTLTAFIELYKGSLPSLIPAVANDSYVITCVATFEDGSQSNATTVATAT